MLKLQHQKLQPFNLLQEMWSANLRGFRHLYIQTSEVVKAFPLSDSLTQHFLKYLNYLTSLNLIPKFWLPSGRSVFGHDIIIPNEHLSEREVFNIVRERAILWPHLFREIAASDIVKQDNLTTTLDHTKH